MGSADFFFLIFFIWLTEEGSTTASKNRSFTVSFAPRRFGVARLDQWFLTVSENIYCSSVSLVAIEENWKKMVRGNIETEVTLWSLNPTHMTQNVEFKMENLNDARALMIFQISWEA